MRFKDKVVIITGAGRGIGQVMAVGFAAEGASVLINEIDRGPAEETLGKIKDKGGIAAISIGSVTDRDYVESMVDHAVKEFGTVDILVNNAGITRTAMILKMSDEQWDQVIDVNLRGVFICMQEVGRVYVKKAKENPDARCNGKIVNITSVAGLRGTVGQINYGAAKAGVIGLTMSGAREWGRYKVNVNAVAFGVVETRLTETIRKDPKFSEIYRSEIVLGRFAKPEEVVPSVLFLSSSDADYITGEVLNVTGGLHIGF
nr:SDR family oxidoreductase [Desulfobacterales bacterium]